MPAVKTKRARLLPVGSISFVALVESAHELVLWYFGTCVSRADRCAACRIRPQIRYRAKKKSSLCGRAEQNDEQRASTRAPLSHPTVWPGFAQQQPSQRIFRAILCRASSARYVRPHPLQYTHQKQFNAPQLQGVKPPAFAAAGPFQNRDAPQTPLNTCLSRVNDSHLLTTTTLPGKDSVQVPTREPPIRARQRPHPRTARGR